MLAILILILYLCGKLKNIRLNEKNGFHRKEDCKNIKN